MSDEAKYPERLFLPPEAFSGFSKYLNIYGKEHVCDGEPYVEFARVDGKAGAAKGITIDMAGAMGKMTPEMVEAMSALLLNPMIKTLELSEQRMRSELNKAKARIIKLEAR